ncbi:MAG: phosphate ABC transporter permease PstA [Fimbriimonadaceae bacterium]|nr:phosphate ABC transporter permease PstA [Fimbriimonadaceae bacterium]
MSLSSAEVSAQVARRRSFDRWFGRVCQGMIWVAIGLLGVLVGGVLLQGLRHLDWQFLSSPPSSRWAAAGIWPALQGTFWLMFLTALIAIPLGLGAAVYMEEYSHRGPFSRWVETNINNLAGVPSIVYGMLGLALFARALNLGASVLAGALTLSLLVLPTIIIASREAIRAVPPTLRQGAFALGATRWQTIQHHTLPAALPGILTSVILALSRGIGETAPLITLGVPVFVTSGPDGLLSRFAAMPMQIYNWAARPQQEFHELAAAGIIVLMALLLSMNAVAIAIRNRAERSLKW